MSILDRLFGTARKADQPPAEKALVSSDGNFHVNEVTLATPVGSRPLITETQLAQLLSNLDSMSPAGMWRSQPNVRTCTGFLGRNIAQLGMPVYQRGTDNGRERVRDTTLALLLAEPNPAQTATKFLNAWASDKALYDEAFLVLARDSSRASGWQIRTLPVNSITDRTGSEWDGTLSVKYLPPGSGPDAKPVTIPAENLIHDRGWNPAYAPYGVSPIITLRDELVEQMAARLFRRAMWKNGGQIGQYIKRPKESGEISDAGVKRLKEQLDSYKAGGHLAGGMPLIEEGMTIEQLMFNARESQWLEATKLHLEACTRAWFINPTMLGSTEGVSYSNVKEFRKMLYGETLGPTLQDMEDVVNTRILRIIDPGALGKQYAEFNVKAKLTGDFLEEADVLSRAAGGPWMLRDEVRSIQNLPKIPGGDELITPLNVIVGGQASPADTQPKSVEALLADAVSSAVITALGKADEAAQQRETIHATGKAASIPSKPTDTDRREIRAVVRKFARRQRSTVLAALGAKANSDWWDAERWDNELADDLHKASLKTTARTAAAVLAAADQDADAYDAERTSNFLAEVAKSRAAKINSTTKSQLDDVLAWEAPDDDPDADPPELSSVFDDLDDARGDSIAATLATTYAAFATTEAGKQIGGDDATKTWITGPNPRPDHAVMDGETVKIADKFSNGADWPGDPVLGAEGVANCNCGIELNFP